MGLFGMIGKIAGSKAIEKVADEFTKKQNREQTKKYCTYIENNIDRVCKSLTDLQIETQSLISEILSQKGTKISFREKGILKKTQDKATKKLQYLYLSRDFFTALSKNATGIALQNEELQLVSKFAPFFDGVPILDMDDKDRDDSLLGEFKEIGVELKSAFVSSNKNSKYLIFEEYLCRYEEKMKEYEMPDIEAAIDSFKDAMAALNVSDTMTNTETFNRISAEESECPNCHAKLGANSKFCSECGAKIEIKKPTFCTQCGEPITSGAKFCAHCGTKV